MIIEGGRASTSPARLPISTLPTRWRLKRSLEVFPASDGTVFLMRMGTGEDLAITDAGPAERTVIECLSSGWQSQAALRQTVNDRGQCVEDVARCLVSLEKYDLLERSGDEGLLCADETERFDRQLIYWADLATETSSAPRMQRRLRDASVVILGCGGLGSWAASALVCAGIGTLVLVDDDEVEASNLNRQLLFAESDIGRPKVECAAGTLRRHNRAVQLQVLRARIGGPGQLRDLLGEADLLLLAADWPPFLLPRWVNRACLEAGVPYITAAQYLPRVRVGPMIVPGESACWTCLEGQTRKHHPHYDELAARSPAPSTSATLGAASGLVGSLLAMEAIHLLTRSVRPATIDGAFVIDLRTLAVTREDVERDPSCRACARAAPRRARPKR